MFFFPLGPWFWLWCQMDGSWGAAKQPQTGFKHHSSWVVLGTDNLTYHRQSFPLSTYKSAPTRKNPGFSTNWRISSDGCPHVGGLWELMGIHFMKDSNVAPFGSNSRPRPLGYNYLSRPQCLDGRRLVDSGCPDDMLRCKYHKIIHRTSCCWLAKFWDIDSINDGSPVVSLYHLFCFSHFCCQRCGRSTLLAPCWPRPGQKQRVMP